MKQGRRQTLALLAVAFAAGMVMCFAGLLHAQRQGVPVKQALTCWRLSSATAFATSCSRSALSRSWNLVRASSSTSLTGARLYPLCPAKVHILFAMHQTTLPAICSHNSHQHVVFHVQGEPQKPRYALQCCSRGMILESYPCIPGFTARSASLHLVRFGTGQSLLMLLFRLWCYYGHGVNESVAAQERQDTPCVHVNDTALTGVSTTAHND